MELDDELCLCFHITQRKVINFLRATRPCRASQLSECGGAGTGCGWCRPYLQQLFDAAQQVSDSGAPIMVALPSASLYRDGRTIHRAAQDSGTGATPPDHDA